MECNTCFYAERARSKTLMLLGAVLIGAFFIFPLPLAAQIMATPGKVEVNSKGSAIYTVPVKIPPGTAGMVPSISLQYSSGGGDGPLGNGWSLSGFSEIDRCGKTLVQDGVVDGIKFNSNDRFCLDGQRLVAVSGTYGADGTEYRTEIESFSKIISHGTTGSGPAWWEVRSKSGQTMEFGNTADSKAMLSGVSSIKSWMINKITDTKGNYLTYTYANNFTYAGVNTGEVLPSTISYTGNAGASLTPYNHIEFVYATRPDITPLYHNGAVTYRTQRLTDVKTWAGTSLVADYRLTYEQSPQTSRSRVASVSQCDGSNACLPATNFGWTGTGTVGTYTRVASTGGNLGVPPASATGYALLSGDFNGDGRTDAAFIGGQTINCYL